MYLSNENILTNGVMDVMDGFNHNHPLDPLKNGVVKSLREKFNLYIGRNLNYL